jgi:sirohydrochlorin ferrochelatase
VKRAILLVDHGSRRNQANEQLERMAELVSERVPDTIVHVAHMEIAEPDIAQGVDACAADGADEIVVHPYFLAPGNHSTSDIPRLVREAAERHPGLRVRVSEPLGLHPKLVDVILDRVDAARD